MRKKFLLALLICIVLMFPCVANAEVGVVSKQGMNMNGAYVEILGYNINGENYFKLRDLAYIFNYGTKPFNITYDTYTKNVVIEPNTIYDGGKQEYTELADNAKAVLSNDKIILGGELKNLKTYKINNTNYTRLRDIGTILDSGISYNAEEGIINIITVISYEEGEKLEKIWNSEKTFDEKIIGNHEELNAKITEELLKRPAEINLLYDGEITRDELGGIIAEIVKTRQAEIMTKIYLTKVRGETNIKHLEIQFMYFSDEEIQSFKANDATNNETNNTVNNTANDAVENTEKSVDAEIDRILQPLNKNDTEYNKVKFIYDYLSNNGRYSMGNEDGLSGGYSVYDVRSILFGDGGLSKAYTELFGQMAMKAGIEVINLEGILINSSGSVSMYNWNMVKIDGNWYHLDVSRASLANSGYIEFDSQEEKVGYMYMNFLKSDDYMKGSYLFKADVNAPKNYGE